jgi:phage N-6-adenine-methyltransferase
MSEHFVNKSSTAADQKDLWQTPKNIFNALDQEFDFDVDICASEDNKLLPDYFTEERSALTNHWNIYSRAFSAFMNPPYSQTQLFMERAAEQSNLHNITVVALVNANTDTKWFADAVKSANEVRLLTGRVGFIKSTGGKSNGNTKGQCIIIWRGNCKTPCVITMVDRKQLESK